MLITCKQASQLISQSLDHPLSWSEKVRLKLHLLICDACTRFKQQLDLLRVAVQRIRKTIEDDSTIQLPPEAKDRIKRKVESGQ